jgi:xanthine/CO dehydrogenase XdhC/CoxF family maturation factor
MSDGHRVGSISGGCLEEDVLAHAHRVAHTGEPTVVKYDTTSENELVWGVGLGCHGIVHVLVEPLPTCPEWAHVLSRNWELRCSTTLAVTWAANSTAELGTRIVPVNHAELHAPENVSIFIDRIQPPTRLLIFGAGDDAQPLHRIAAEIGWDTLVADPRSAYATTTRFPAAQHIVCGPAESLVALTRPDAYSVAVVMTHHYVHDVPILRDLLPLKLRYIGLLGPKKRGAKILGDLAAAGSTITAEQRATLHSPIGLDIGAETPEEVAISIMAEIRTSLSGRNGGALKNRERPIHG